LRAVDWGNTERAIRINQGELGLQDLEAILPYAYVEMVVCPKIETAEQIKKISNKIKEI